MLKENQFICHAALACGMSKNVSGKLK